MGGLLMERNILLLSRHFPGINPLIAGEEHCSPLHSYGPASREYYLIHYIVSGKGVFKCEGTDYHLSSGDMFLICPGRWSTYTADEKDPWHYVWVGFSSEFDLSDIFSHKTLKGKPYGSLFSDILSCKSRACDAEYYVCGKIYELLAFLAEQKPAPKPGAPEHYARMAKNFIDANYAKPISVQMIADTLNLNRSYLSTLFKRYTGKSPQAYLVDYRLHKAAFFMVCHHYPPSKAAICCGYTDLFNFSKMFKRKYGISPRAYWEKGKQTQ